MSKVKVFNLTPIHNCDIVPIKIIESIKPGDTIVFPYLSKMKIEPLISYGHVNVYYIGVKINGIDCYLRMNSILHRPQTKLDCISSLQKKLMKLDNWLDRLKYLSGKTVKCIYRRMDMIREFDPSDGSTKMETIKVNGKLTIRPKLRPILIPFIVEEKSY